MKDVVASMINFKLNDMFLLTEVFYNNIKSCKVLLSANTHNRDHLQNIAEEFDYLNYDDEEMNGDIYY